MAAFLTFELRYWLKNGAFYTYAGLFFLLGLFTMAGAAGVFGEGSSDTATANAPLQLFAFVQLFGKLLLLVLPAVVGTPVYRDYASGMHRILYSYPFSKKAYLLGKFLSGLLAGLFIALLAVLGLAIGTQLPGVDPDKLLPMDAGAYLQLYFLYLLPNILVVSVLVFCAVGISRSLYAGFFAVLLFWLFRDLILRILGDSTAGLLLEPFGESTTQFFTQNLTAIAKNSAPLPLEPAILFNRGLWLGLALVGFGWFYRWFSFDLEPPVWRWRRSQTRAQRISGSGGLATQPVLKVQPDFSFFQKIRIVWRLAQTDCSHILRSRGFQIILGAGALFLVLTILNLNPQTDTNVLPCTWVILGLPMLFFSLLVQGLTFLYAGLLVHRARLAGMSSLVDATPAPNWVIFLSKLLALVGIQLVLLGMVLVVGLAVQQYRGFDRPELGHYLFDLLGVHLPEFIIWALAALFVQSLLTNPYLGLFILIGGSLALGQLPGLGITSPVFIFNQTPDPHFYLRYSEMNGHAHGLAAHFLYKIYWLVFGLLLGGGALLAWQRGLPTSVGERWRLAKTRFSGPLAGWIVASALVFTAFGAVLFLEENKPLNRQLSALEQQQQLARFQQDFEKFRHTAQPRITALFFNMEIAPKTQTLRVEGRYTLVNKTARPIDTLLIKCGYDEQTELQLPAGTRMLAQDSLFKFAVYQISSPLAPGDSLNFGFYIINKPNTWLTRNSNVLENGTQIKNDIFPRLGYFAETEKAVPGDPAAHQNHYQSIDADVIDLEAVVHTDPNQTVVAPGYLKKMWTADGRRHFHFKTDQPVKFVFSVLSGRYAQMEEQYKDVDLRIYHHPEHTYCLPQLMAGMKAALDYNTANFSPYPHRQINLVEFPRSEGSYATTAANCIPVSEIRFVHDTSRAGAVDIAFYVAAHELSHQWWGNQLLPADAPGATMLTESIAEYVTAKAYEKQYGKNSALKFLQIQRKRYLSGHNAETATEPPLVQVLPEQPYLAYGKGALAFYTLSEQWGEARLNAALRTFLLSHNRPAPPYAIAVDLVSHLKNTAPESLRPLIGELFEGAEVEPFLNIVDTWLLAK
ncbi:MAG: hypothetical protein KDD14_11495 [Saprospiraceae bacterium]|nr:hypothetical protein [Saprospiraceae bacterium]